MTDIWLIARKDLKIEMRSRVLMNQVAPFALIILVLVWLKKLMRLL